jgi:hypothetical protein
MEGKIGGIISGLCEREYKLSTEEICFPSTFVGITVQYACNRGYSNQFHTVTERTHDCQYLPF